MEQKVESGEYYQDKENRYQLTLNYMSKVFRKATTRESGAM